MSINQLKEFNENEKNQALQDFSDRLSQNQNILEQNKEELRQRVNNLIDPIGAEVFRLSGERLLKKYGLKNYYDAIRKGDADGFVKQATSDVNNKIQQIVSDKADPFLKSVGLNDEQISNFKNGEFDKLGDTALNTVINKANDVENNLDVRNALANNNLKPEEIDAVMDSDLKPLLINKAEQFDLRLPIVKDKYLNGLNNQGQAEFGKLTNNENPTVDNIGTHDEILDNLLANPNFREAQGLVGGGRPTDVPFFSVPDLIKQHEWSIGAKTGGAEKDILTPEQREEFERQDFAEDLARADRARRFGEVRPIPEDITGGLPNVDFRQVAGNRTRAEVFREQGREDPSKVNRGGSLLEPRQEPLSNPNVIDGSYSRGSYKVPSKAQPQQAPPPEQPTAGPQSQIEDAFPITDEDLEAGRPALEAFRRQFPPPPPKPEQTQSISGVQTAGQDISEGLGGLAAVKQGRNLFRNLKNRGSSKQQQEPEQPQEPQQPEPEAETPSTETVDEPAAPQAQPKAEPTQEPTAAPAEVEKAAEDVTKATSEAEATEDVSEAGKIAEIGDATAENAAKLSADGAGQIFADAGLAEGASEGFLNPIMDGVGLITGIAGLLMGSGIFNKKPAPPPKPAPIQDVSVVAGASGEGQI